MSKKAFTLVELLVVISIIALLMSILMPSLSKARAQAKRVVCANNIKQIAIAAIAYAVENNGILPPGGHHEPEFSWDDDIAIRMDLRAFSGLATYIVGTRTISLDTKLSNQEAEKYVKKAMNNQLRKCFRCPELNKKVFSFSGALNPIPSSMKDSTLPFTFVLVNWPGETIYSVAMGYNYMAGFETEKWPNDKLPAEAVPWTSPRRLSDAGNLAFITDNNRYVPYGGAYQPFPSYEVMHTGRGHKLVTGIGLKPLENPAKEYPNAGTNVGYMDGSVVFKRLSSLDLHIVMATNGRFYQKEFNWF